jgi:hypothetical protein
LGLKSQQWTLSADLQSVPITKRHAKLS